MSKAPAKKPSAISYVMVTNSRSPDMVRAGDFQHLEPVGINSVARMRIGCSGAPINRFDPQQAHQPPDTATPDFIPLTPQMPDHLTRSIKPRGKELRVDQTHEREIVGAFPAPLVSMSSGGTKVSI